MNRFLSKLEFWLQPKLSNGYHIKILLYMFLKNKNKNCKFTYVCMYIYILNPNVLEILESTN